jgi:outer membrane protein
MLRSILSVAIAMVALQTTTGSAKADEPKIGYVDMARALHEVDDGKAAQAKLKGDFDQKQQKLDKMQSDLKAKKDEFEKRATMMKPDAKQAKQEELQREFMEVQKTYMQLQQELVESEGALTQEIGKKLRTVIEKLGDRDGYLVILNIGDTVLYSKRHMDVTDEIIKGYNKQFGKK